MRAHIGKVKDAYRAYAEIGGDAPAP